MAFLSKKRTECGGGQDPQYDFRLEERSEIFYNNDKNKIKYTFRIHKSKKNAKG